MNLNEPHGPHLGIPEPVFFNSHFPVVSPDAQSSERWVLSIVSNLIVGGAKSPGRHECDA